MSLPVRGGLPWRPSGGAGRFVSAPARPCQGASPLFPARQAPIIQHKAIFRTGASTMDEQAGGPPRPKYRRVVLKLSGEGLGQPGRPGINIDETLNLARQVQRVAGLGVQVALVVGGGNILRGAQFSAGGDVVKKATAHYMGMLATVLNGLALQDALESLNCETRLLSAIRMEVVAEPYIRRRAIRHLEKGRVVILAGGTGNPFVTTDTAAALRARELEADVLLKGTKVDGVYSDDPLKNPHATRYERLTHAQFLNQNLKVMDRDAVGQCMDGRVPILVFDFKREGNI